MRKIQCRAWDQYHRKMVYKFDGIEYDFICHSDGELEAICLIADGVSTIQLLECTGLKDRNGKEIFEGDILDGEGEIGVMKFGTYEHRYHHGMLGFYLDCGELGIFDGPTAEIGEVIGNIYENPELLKR